MPILQKQNLLLRRDLLSQTLAGFVIPGKFYTLDSDGNLALPGPAGNTLLKKSSFKLIEEGALLDGRYVKEMPAGHITVSGDASLVDPNSNLMLPVRLVPSARSIVARERGVANNLLIKVHGGVGDVVCSEPAIRFAIERFGDKNEISLCTDYPEFFQHLKFKEIFPATGGGQPDYSKYLLFQNFSAGDELAWEFVAHALTHAVDYASLNMWRAILPNKHKNIILVPSDRQRASMRSVFPLGFFEQPLVVVHPGKTWDSRTFPKQWWDAVLAKLRSAGVMPVLIGGEVDVDKDGKARASTVDVNTDGCLDLRGKLSFIETTALLQEANVLLTNDSSPLHMAASGRAFIGFCSTVKDESHLMHWRTNGAGNLELGYQMKNFSSGNLFSTLNFCPNQEQAIHIDGLHINELNQWLPVPEEFAAWAIGKVKPYAA